MAISKEVKTGLMVSISVIVIIIGTYFLKGFNLFSSDHTYYIYFENVQGLTPSAAVQVNGLQVGNVSEIKLEGKNKVKVVVSVDKKIHLTEGTTASLAAPDLLSGKVLSLNMGTGTKALEDEAIIPAKTELGAIEKITSQIDPVMANANMVMLRLDSIMISLQTMLNPETQQNLHQSMASIELTMRNFASLSTSLNRESAQLAGIIRNANSITQNIANNSENIDGVLKNLRATTDQLSKADLDKTVKSLHTTLAETQILMAKINKGDGSLGMMANDKQLYSNLTTTLSSLDKLIIDLQDHPSRYINIRLFGKNKER
ncbi:MAG: MlaD family protein [Chitinophagaceae bacterium]|jgi:phospholipid/cholesterol/gamma-HCH transport system substrate-binding protein